MKTTNNTFRKNLKKLKMKLGKKKKLKKVRYWREAKKIQSMYNGGLWKENQSKKSEQMLKSIVQEKFLK